MHNLLEILATILPIIALSLLSLVLLVNIFIRIRRKFPVNVNCWFCNSWTKVPYDNIDGFDCPSCTQYNGFTKDGGYNKIIPEQHDELLNKSRRNQKKKPTVSPTNGLCTLCNNNQQLKVYQLAHFVPLVDENYDVEIEHFQKQLEKAYKLCRKCDKTLKTTIEKQNIQIFGKQMKNLKAKAENLIEINKSFMFKLNNIIIKVIRCLSTLIVIALLCNVLIKKITYFENLLPNSALPYWHFIKEYTVLNITKPIYQMIPEHLFKYVENPILSACGMVLQIFLIFDKYTKDLKINQTLCWTILLLTNCIKNSKNAEGYIFFLQIFSGCYIIYSMFNLTYKKPKAQKLNGKAIRKMVRNLETTCSDTSTFLEDEAETYSDESSINKIETNWNNSSPEMNIFTANNNTERDTSFTKDIDINNCLNNLHLDGIKQRIPSSQSSSASSIFTVNSIKRPRPVLSPSKFNQNSWVAGGYWKNQSYKPNLSRTSSESSGFESQQNDIYSSPPSRTSFSGDYDKLSMVSEPAYYNNQQPNTFFGQQQFYLRNENTFYPILSPNNMLFIDSRSGFYTPSIISNPKPMFLNNPPQIQRESVFKTNWSMRNNEPSFNGLNQNMVFKQN